MRNAISGNVTVTTTSATDKRPARIARYAVANGIRHLGCDLLCLVERIDARRDDLRADRLEFLPLLFEARQLQAAPQSPAPAQNHHHLPPAPHPLRNRHSPPL